MICAKCGTRQTASTYSCELCGALLGGESQPAAPAAPESAAAPPPEPPSLAALARRPPDGLRVGTVIRPTNPMATAGFVFGLCGITPILGVLSCIAAIVLSSVALARVPERQGVGRGYAIAGLAMGIAFIVPSACWVFVA